MAVLFHGEGEWIKVFNETFWLLKQPFKINPLEGIWRVYSLIQTSVCGQLYM